MASFDTIGVIAHQLSRTGESRTVEAVVEAARQHGHTVSLIDVDSPSSSDVTQAVQRLTHQAIDGLIIIRAETAAPATLVLPPNLPVAVSDSRFVGHHPAVGADQVGGSHAAVAHLLELGHRTVHHLAGPASSGPAGLRATAWAGCLRAAGRPIPPLVRGDWSGRSGYEAGLRLADDEDVTAIFAANDEMACGLLRALHQRGRRVPDDVSVVGFDDIELAEYLSPSLTTVRQQFHLIGRELVDVIIRQLADRSALSDLHITVPAPLIVRESTGPSRRR